MNDSPPVVRKLDGPQLRDPLEQNYLIYSERHRDLRERSPFHQGRGHKTLSPGGRVKGEGDSSLSQRRRSQRSLL